MSYKINVKHTSIVIENYTLGDKPSFEKYLSVWDEGKFRFNPIGFMYREDTKELLIPRGVNINYIEKEFDTTANVLFTPDPYENVSIKLKAPPRDNVQKDAIAFLIGETNFKYTKKYTQLLLNLDPGVGKTYITTAALTFLGMKTIVITHIEKIKNQWKETLLDKTDLSENHICNIKNSNVISKLLKDKNPKYKVYLINHGTISSYAKKHGWQAIGELFRHLKTGVKIYDEAHLNFANIIKIDLNTNTKKTIYLTATFGRTNRYEDRLFNICFSNLVKFTAKLSNELSKKKKEARKHTIYVSVLYDSKPSLDTQAYMSTNRGFNKNRYSNYQRQCEVFYKVIKYMVKYFLDKEGKLMILSSMIESVESIKDFLNENFGENKGIYSYHSKLDNDTKERALLGDIICTTPLSAGTGFDLPGLRTIIMAESYSSKIEAKQVSGRLREYSPDEYTFYVELVDTGFKKAHDMYRRRLKYFKDKCAKVLCLDLRNKDLD